MAKYNECKFYSMCDEDKKVLCTIHPDLCLIYLKFEFLEKNNQPTKIKTGLERFIDRYGEDWRLIAYGEQCGGIADFSTNGK